MMKKQDKILTRLVLGTILAGGAGLMMPQVGYAAPTESTSTEVTITETEANDADVTVFANMQDDSGKHAIVSSELTSYTSASLAASNYTLTINSGTMKTVYGGYTSAATAEGNTVTINGGTIGAGDGYSEAVVGGKAATTASNNTINIKGGTITGSIIGGDGATASNNTINISGGTIGADSAWTSINAGRSTTDGGTASGNTITISGDVEFLGNVLISTGTVQGTSGTTGTSSNNTLNILTAITVAELSGGDGATHSGNTLNIAAKGVTTNGLMAFDSINFYLPSDIANGETMLTVKGNSEFGTTVDLTGVTYGVTALSGVSLKKGDTVNLILGDGATLNTDATLSTVASSTLSSASFLSLASLDTVDTYTLSISKCGDNAIIATVDNVTSSSTDDSNNSSNSSSSDSGNSNSSSSTSNSSSDVKKSTVETRAASVSMLTQASDFMASTGFSEAANAVSQAAAEAQASGAEAPTSASFTPFAAMGGQKMRAESGSHVDIKGYGLNVGFAKEIANKDGKLLFGPVVEYGRGSYDSYNNDVHGDGDSSFWGIGIMARQTNNDGLYYEGSVRGGRSKSDYSSSVTVGGVPVNLSYDSSSTYWSAHLGVGKIFAVSADNTVDAYLKYFYTHQSGDTVTLNPGLGTLDFDSVDSNRIRIGSRLTHKINNKDSIYGGLAYQYEFGGEARATYNGTATPAPSVKGSSGMLELGYILKASDKVSLDFGVTGWAGKQRGITGQIGALWKF